VKLHHPAPKILDFDIEARPLGWYGGDWVHKEVTAIAWSFGGTVDFSLIHKNGGEMEMLMDFQHAFNEADIVTGHYVRGFDLPVLQMAYMEYELPLLGQKMVHDTKIDLLKSQGHSKSQENLAAELGIAAPKIKMTTADWRSANRLEPAGLKLVRDRVVGDVKQHMAMRNEMMNRGWLRPPRVWTPGNGAMHEYQP
jgi:DNA polymerase elongation subunit (family B)